MQLSEKEFEESRRFEELQENTTEANDLAPNDDSEDSAESHLDLSSLNEETVEEVEEPSPEAVEAAGETLFNKTVSMMEEGEIDPEHGIMLLKKAANDGCSLSWIYLGRLYSDEKSAMHNPALAFECFAGAAKLDNCDGCYNLGLCYNEGFGCEKDEGLAVESFLHGASLGGADCICALGICREFGIGCEIDYEMSAALYEKASELGNAAATNNLAGCYFYGHGVPQDKEKAVELYRKAAEMGNSNAECRLGICYESGEGCEKDESLAAMHYERAAEGNNAIALYRLALCYDNGIGKEQNYANAFKYYCLAAEAGNPEAMHEAGMMYKNGRGTKKDEAEAYKMFSSAATAGISSAEYEVGNCYFEGIGTVRNREFAFVRYTRAYDFDPQNFAAAFKLGLCNLKGLGTAKDKEAAFQWFCRGDELGSPSATYMKGECYYYGVGIQEDKNAAAACYEKAVSYDYDYVDNLRTVPATLALARCLEEGIGVTQDPRRAMSLYKAAAETGDPEAMYLTGRAIMSGVGMRAEYAAARIYILRAARKGYVPAMLTMGILADEGKGIPKNRADAKRWYMKVINADIAKTPELYCFPDRFLDNLQLESDAKTQARYRLGMLLTREDPSSQSYMLAFEHIALAAAAGCGPAQTEVARIYVAGGDLKGYYENPKARENTVFADGNVAPDDETLGAAMNKLGDSLFDGTGIVKKNEIAAAKCYKIAAQLGHNDACYSYGWCLRHGVGLRENNAEAVKWLKLSADRGNMNACYSYGLCCEEGSGTGIKNRREALQYYRMAAASGHSEAAQRYIKLSERDD